MSAPPSPAESHHSPLCRSDLGFLLLRPKIKKYSVIPHLTVYKLNVKTAIIYIQFIINRVQTSVSAKVTCRFGELTFVLICIDW